MANKGKTKWVKIEDNKVRHIWKCKDGEPGCKGKASVTPDWYQENGTPVCSECDRDMAYSHTEILGFQGWLGTYTPDTNAGKVRSSKG